MGFPFSTTQRDDGFEEDERVYTQMNSPEEIKCDFKVKCILRKTTPRNPIIHRVVEFCF